MTLQANAIVSVQDVRDWLDDQSLTESDVDWLINRASDLVENMAGVRFQYRTFTVYYDGNDAEDLVLQDWPVEAIHELYVDSARDFGADDQWVEGTDFLVYTETGILKVFTEPSSQILKGRVWPAGKQNVKIVLTAGYPTVPGDVVEATLLIIQDRWARRGGEREVKRESVLNYSVEYASSAEQVNTPYGAIPATAAEILTRYSDFIGNGGLRTEG